VNPTATTKAVAMAAANTLTAGDVAAGVTE